MPSFVLFLKHEILNWTHRLCIVVQMLLWPLVLHVRVYNICARRRPSALVQNPVSLENYLYLPKGDPSHNVEYWLLTIYNFG